MSVFSNVGGLRPRRSVFNLSYSKKFTADMGILYPVMCDELIPGDSFTISARCIVRAMPLVAPVMHNIKVKCEYFFVPYRLLWDDWETFITKGVDGDTTLTPPVWNSPYNINSPYINEKDSIHDMIFPNCPTGVYGLVDWNPSDFPRQAYNLNWNEFYRDQNVQALLTMERGPNTNNKLLRRAWKKDYFTSALPWQQRGTPPAIPISGFTNAEFNNVVWNGNHTTGLENLKYSMTRKDGNFSDGDGTNAQFMENKGAEIKHVLSNNTVDLSGATTFTPSDLRLAFQIQKWQERNSRAGIRYTEFLNSHFGVHPRDDRLQRPEFIGSFTQPLIISEVVQTSESATTPQGTLRGHGISVDSGYVGKYYAQEFGLIMGLFSIIPEANYFQGINRQWVRKTPFDFPFPEFVNLSEQAVYNYELDVVNPSPDRGKIFGYQGRFNELRYKESTVHGLLRTTLKYWHLARDFASPPNLNSEFIECNPSKRIFAVPSEPGFIVDFANIIRAVRPIPISSEPGLIDHN